MEPATRELHSQRQEIDNFIQLIECFIFMEDGQRNQGFDESSAERTKLFQKLKRHIRPDSAKKAIRECDEIRTAAKTELAA